MRPPPRGMTMEMVAVLDASVPVLFRPVALTAGPFAGFTVTVMGVFNGMFEQCTTIGIGFACCAGMMTAGLAGELDGLAGMEVPAMLAIDNCAPEPAAGMMIG